MKKQYAKPEADKIRFNYRDQVVAASGTGAEQSSGSSESFMQSSMGVGSWACGDGGLVDMLFDFVGTSLCA